MAAPEITCPRCAASSRVLVVPYDRTGGRGAEVRTCASAVCGVGFTVPAPSGVAAARTSGALGEAGGGLAQRIVAAGVSRLASLLPRGALVVDAGAGSGLRSRALVKRGFSVVAIEPDPVEAMRAHAVLAGTDAEVAVAGVEAIGEVLGGRRADAVMMWHVVEHLEDVDAALAGVSRALRPGGLLQVAVPNRASAEARAFGPRWHGWEPSRHRWHFDEDSLRLVLGAAGFGVGGIGTRGGWGYPAGIAYSIAPGLDPQVNPSTGPLGRMLAAAMIPVALGARALGRGGQLVTVARRRRG